MHDLKIFFSLIFLCIKQHLHNHFLMSYPNLATVLSMKKDAEEESNIDSMFKMIQDCMYQIWQGEETFDVTDYTDKDKQDFLDSLNHEQFEKIQNFFETMPTIKHTAKYTCKTCGEEKETTVQGLQSFFR